MGFSVLELSKFYMNNVWRNCLSKKLKDPVLYMSDTGNIFYENKTQMLKISFPKKIPSWLA